MREKKEGTHTQFQLMKAVFQEQRFHVTIWKTPLGPEYGISIEYSEAVGYLKFLSQIENSNLFVLLCFAMCNDSSYNFLGHTTYNKYTSVFIKEFRKIGMKFWQKPKQVFNVFLSMTNVFSLCYRGPTWKTIAKPSSQRLFFICCIIQELICALCPDEELALPSF